MATVSAWKRYNYGMDIPRTPAMAHKGDHRPVEPLTIAEVSSLLNACSTRSTGGIRDRALIAVLYGAGLRISEALALKPSDVNASACSIRVLKGKRNKRGEYQPRTVHLDALGCALLLRWLDHRKTLGIQDRKAPLFCSYTRGKEGKPLDQRQVRASLARLATKAGIDKRVHPHGLRHSMAVNLLENGTGLAVIQQQLGHSAPSVTDTYLRGLSAANTAEAIDAANLFGEDR